MFLPLRNTIFEHQSTNFLKRAIELNVRTLIPPPIKTTNSLPIANHYVQLWQQQPPTKSHQIAQSKKVSTSNSPNITNPTMLQNPRYKDTIHKYTIAMATNNKGSKNRRYKQRSQDGTSKEDGTGGSQQTLESCLQDKIGTIGAIDRSIKTNKEQQIIPKTTTIQNFHVKNNIMTLIMMTSLT